MCGFVGVLLKENTAFSEEHLTAIKESNKLIKHRGPDEEGYYSDSYMALAFRRLKIMDLKAGSQPFYFGGGRYVLTFNGEIYNYKILREELRSEGFEFHTDSDTEVVAKLFQSIGVKAFSKLRGMFSIIIWDSEERTLYGARDHFGIKPLYYCESDCEFTFASERKCITYLNQLNVLDTVAIQHYLSFQYVPNPLTLTEGVCTLEPGNYFIKEWGEPLETYSYFKPAFNPVLSSEKQVIHQIKDVLSESVHKHMQSDVPLGAFLSGGIDSTFIVALAREINPKIKTFSVGFARNGYSEIDVAQETAAKLNVENISSLITPQEFVEALPKIMWHMDDPLADPACIPLYFLSKKAKEDVTVVLSGEGADELFGGYEIYREAESLKYFKYLPSVLSKKIYQLSCILPEGMKGKSFLQRGTTPLQDRYIGNAKIFEEQEKNQLFKQYNPNYTYKSWTEPLYAQVKESHPTQQMQFIDMHTWLIGDILLKADKMSMAHSLEVRVPFLDKEVFDLASKIPVEQKIAEGTTKSILRKAAQGIVPEHVINRKKLGFPVPIKHWLREELYEWAKNLIRESQTEHIFDKNVIFSLLEKHAQMKGDYSRKLWTVLTFMVWHSVYMEQNEPISIRSREHQII
ncbi:asparagine synthase (glutamine-hydrolyzing) [Virgibacillus halodenitrificans]|uniref:asparagine synthase (glutamine-hydrolyzing) n=1 Tax=Virgibacillus halodenitrificans TaxID=1482 RepID=A0AAC9J6J2_VIRHA|nr:asparagine synthase (glutamine-hydrolyzing) [Virgibacillus halodenitrificans]APC49889.1 asparagine synthase (glutamine-hydrolyzing) [Virgibacillus halodenitrificans]